MINKIKEIETKIIDFITNHYEIFIIAFFLILSLILRIKLFNYESKDYTKFLSVWFDTLKNNGGIKGLGMSVGNYNAPYIQIIALLTYFPVKSLFSIKIISVIFDYLLIFLSYKLMRNITKHKENDNSTIIIGTIILLLLPTIIINSAMWAQCDVIYTFFIILSIYFLQKDKTTPSFISLGIAFAFKLQAIFIIPAYLIIYMKKRNFSIFNFLWIPISNIVLSIPSLMMGKSIIEIFKVYIDQTNTYSSHLNMAFPNLYSLINFNNTYFIKHAANIFGISIVLLIFSILLYLTLKSKKELKFNNILLLSIISILVCVYFLPHMHERYMFMADILCIIYAFSYKKGIIKALGIELLSLNAYFCCLSGSFIVPEYISSMILLTMLILYIREYLINMEIIRKDNL